MENTKLMLALLSQHYLVPFRIREAGDSHATCYSSKDSKEYKTPPLALISFIWEANFPLRVNFLCSLSRVTQALISYNKVLSE